MKSLIKLLQNIKFMAIDGFEVVGGPDPWDTTLVVDVRPTKGKLDRCPKCGKRGRYYDEGGGARLWRALDLGVTKVYFRGRAPRVRCAEHGVVVASVPWARHGSWFTRGFEDWVCWMTVNCTRSTVAECCRIDWKTVGPVVSRVQADLEAARGSRLDGLVDIGIDETSYRKGYKYLTLVVDHATGEVVWAHDGYGKSVLEGFFGSLSDEQKSSIRRITGDGAGNITECAEEHCPGAERLLDPFHVVSWATDALDEVRRRVWNDLRREEKAERRGRGRPKKGEERPPSAADAVKKSRWPLLKNPENLTGAQEAKLALLAAEDGDLYRGYLLKERLRLLLKSGPGSAAAELDAWLSWACRCRIPEFVELSRKIRRHRGRILDTVASGLSNARLEAINNKVKVAVRMAYGFHDVGSLISLIMLRCSGLPVTLPGRRPKAVRARPAAKPGAAA
ncbi:MAG: ISL3 family transposase [Coriobacteriia bacterium]|nr:ISL3 family transposase [Coriobacteriia bacterium]